MLMCLEILIPFGMLRLKFTPTFSHPSLSRRQLLCVPFARLHAEHSTPCFDSNQNSSMTSLLIYVSHSLFERAPSSLCSFVVVPCARRSWCMGGVSHLRFAWCSHHPPLTLTPLGLASQDFRLASGTLFSPAERNLGEGA